MEGYIPRYIYIIRVNAFCFLGSVCPCVRVRWYMGVCMITNATKVVQEVNHLGALKLNSLAFLVCRAQFRLVI